MFVSYYWCNTVDNLCAVM